MSKKGSKVYRLRIDLLGTRPPIWRRIEVQDGTLEDLHYHIQDAMGWEDSHLHSFRVHSNEYSIPSDDGYDMDGTLDSTTAYLSKLIIRKGQKFRYTYDFGDDWEHEIKVEEISKPAAKTKYPRCIKGRGNCPPEDCGGTWGFYDMIAAVADPEHSEHEEYSEWFGDYDPTEFDAKETTKLMQ